MQNRRMPRPRVAAPPVVRRAASGALLTLLLAGCATAPFGIGGNGGSARKAAVYQNERFQADETYSRLFDGSVDEACEAARRALLSQGYVITNAQSGLVNGSKRFQPEGEVHVEINFNVVCVADGRDGKLATAYVSAQQDRYTLKKSQNSASIGVSALGSISMPLSSTQDSMVKVASETIPAGEFYDRFFALMHKLLREQSAEREAAAPTPARAQ